MSVETAVPLKPQESTLVELEKDGLSLSVRMDFEQLVPISEDDFQDLEQNILSDGFIRHALTVWICGNEMILVDGHNRYRIWNKHSDTLPSPTVVFRTFQSELEAKSWILRSALGGRNLTPEDRAMCRARMLEFEQAIDRERSPEETKPEKSAAERVAEKTKTSVATVYRSKNYSDALNEIGKVSPGAKKAIENGTVKLPQADVVSIGQMDEESIGHALDNVKQGRRWDDDKGASPPSQDDLEEDIKSTQRKAVEKHSDSCDHYFGKLMRSTTELAKAVGMKDGTIHDGCRNALEVYLKGKRELENSV